MEISVSADAGFDNEGNMKHSVLVLGSDKIRKKINHANLHSKNVSIRKLNIEQAISGKLESRVKSLHSFRDGKKLDVSFAMTSVKATATKRFFFPPQLVNVIYRLVKVRFDLCFHYRYNRLFSPP